MSCLFCKIVSLEIPAEIITESELSVAFNDISPQAPTHVLIVPKDHFPSVAELANNNPANVADLFILAGEIAETRGLTGYRTVFNTGAEAGQSVFHAHLHLLGGRPLNWPPG